MIEPLTLNCAYFRKKGFLLCFLGAGGVKMYFVRGGIFVLGKHFLGGIFAFFVYQAKYVVCY